MPDNIAAASWQQPRTLAQVNRTFIPGRQVRHLNPALAEWLGTVTPGVAGPHKGRCVNAHYAAGHQGASSVDVRVVWQQGDIGDGRLPVTGWYSAYALAPV